MDHPTPSTAPEVEAALDALDGLDARSPAARPVTEKIHALVGPPESRRFAVVDLILARYRCGPATGWRYVRIVERTRVPIETSTEGT